MKTLNMFKVDESVWEFATKRYQTLIDSNHRLTKQNIACGWCVLFPVHAEKNDLHRSEMVSGRHFSIRTLCRVHLLPSLWMGK